MTDSNKQALTRLALSQCRDGSDLDKIEAACILMDVALGIFHGIDESSVSRQRERERARSLNALARWAHAHGIQSNLQNELVKWEKNIEGNYQRLEAADKLWRKQMPIEVKIRQMVETIMS